MPRKVLSDIQDNNKTQEVKVYSLIVSENIIATIKIRNNFWYPLKMVILLPIYLSLYLFNFEIAKVVATRITTKIKDVTKEILCRIQTR